MSELKIKRYFEDNEISKKTVSSLENNLNSLLRCKNNSRKMTQGQIIEAAEYVMANIDYDWLNFDKTNQCYLAICTRFHLRLMICKIVLDWHKNPKRVWMQFEAHAFKINARKITNNLIKRLSVKSQQ